MFSLGKKSVNYSQVNTQSTEDDTDALNEINTENDYDRTLLKSMKSVKYYFVVVAVYSFFHTNRVSIYLLYANEFNPSTIALSLLVYGYNFWNGIASLVYSSLSNQYGYDFMICILLVLQLIGVLLESISTNFWMLFIGVMIAQIAIPHIIIGYIAWILPLKHSKIYISYFWASFVFSYLIGPLLSGFTSYYLSNRMVFVLNLVIVTICTIFGFSVLWKTQKHIEQQQLTVHIVDDKDDQEQFPICLNNTTDTELKWYQAPDLSFTHWIMLICIIYTNVTVPLAEQAFLLFFALYIIEDLNGKVYEGTLAIVINATTFIIGNLMVPKLFTKYDITDVKTILYIIIVCVLLLLLFMYLYCAINILTFYYFNCAMVGFPLGVLSMSSETVLLIVQPAKYSGKISGIKGLFGNWMQAVSALAITIWWNDDHNALFYVIIIAWSISILCIFVMFLTRKYWLQENGNMSNNN